MSPRLALLLLVACGGPDPDGGAGDSGVTQPATTTTLGPGVSQEDFEEAYVAAYCDAYAACLPDATGCPMLGTFTSSTTGCAWDPWAAEACVEGEFHCEEELGIVQSPLVCAEVCNGDTGG